jgi:AMMECR1 domain-containing protein
MARSRFILLERFLDRYHIRQIAAFQEWISRHGFSDRGAFIDLPQQERFLRKGPLSFVLCLPRGLPRALEKNGRKGTKGWYRIFHSDELEIWEFYDQQRDAVMPLRFGLSQDEREFALDYVRRVLDRFLAVGDMATLLTEACPERFRQEASADVALWVGGALRGSQITERLPLIAALHSAAIRSCRDARFKPIGALELQTARIEISLLGDLRIPLLERQLRSGRIDTHNGYVLSTGTRKGWFLPTVFNCIAFKDLDEFLTRLTEEKAGVSRTVLDTALVSMYAVESFIESSGAPHSLALCGPVVAKPMPSDAHEALRHMAILGADFLCRIQEPDGNIPPIINVLTGKRTQIDWIRLPFVAWSLAEMGNAERSSTYLDAARKAHRYLTEQVYTHPHLPQGTRCLSLIYGFKLAAALGELTEAEKLNALILDLLPELAYEPILYSQAAAHLLANPGTDALLRTKAEAFVTAVAEDYERRLHDGAHLALAPFPELMPLLYRMDHHRTDHIFRDRSEAIRTWYLSEQLPDGSFPDVRGSQFAYTRGTGKILEVLCLEPAKNADSIARAVQWLQGMQYGEDNSYFIEDSVQKEILGGFRHDYLNPSVWMDAAGHVLIAASRLKAEKK